MEYEHLRFDVQEGVATITLDRPEANNAINGQIARELMDVSLRCDQDPGVRAALLLGEGDRFCVGGDLKEFREQGDDAPRHLKEMLVYFHAAVSRFARMNAPLIVGVHGAAAGAGMSLVCMSDIALASPSATFVMAYTRAGLTPDGSSTYYLARVVGLHRALDLTLTNRRLTAEEALEWGLVSRVVDDVKSEAEALAKELANGATLALGTAKKLLHLGWREPLETQMEHEAEAIARMIASPDGQEGIAAFVEKREPKFGQG